MLESNTGVGQIEHLLEKMSDIQEYPDVVQEVRGALVSSYLGILCFLLLPSAQTSITACEVAKSKN